MSRISFSGNEKSIEAIWHWYEDQKQSILNYRLMILRTILYSENSTTIPQKFLTLTVEEVNEYFMQSERELEHLVSFDLISATEAYLRMDFYQKVYNKDKSALSRIFRKIHKKNGDKISLEIDIIENWKLIFPENKSKFSAFLGLLKYRHWLAHGRYWTPKFGQNYTPMVAYSIVDAISIL